MTNVVQFPGGRTPKPRFQICIERDFGMWCVATYRDGDFYRRVLTDTKEAAQAELRRLVATGEYELRNA